MASAGAKNIVLFPDADFSSTPYTISFGGGAATYTFTYINDGLTADAVSTGGADPQTGPPIEGVDNFVPMVLGTLEGVATVHHCHTPEITLTSPTTATGIWAMEDLLFFPDGTQLHGAGHYRETYEKRDGEWLIKRLHLTRTLLRFSGTSE